MSINQSLSNSQKEEGEAGIPADQAGKRISTVVDEAGLGL